MAKVTAKQYGKTIKAQIAKAKEVPDWQSEGCLTIDEAMHLVSTAHESALMDYDRIAAAAVAAGQKPEVLDYFDVRKTTTKLVASVITKPFGSEFGWGITSAHELVHILCDTAEANALAGLAGKARTDA